MHQILLIERYQSSGTFKENLIKDKKILKLSIQQILNKYDGYEGEVVTFSKLEDLENVEKFIEECSELKQLSNCKLLHIFSNSYQIPSFLKDQAIKVGYDVGVCEGDAVFSSIFHEVMFGLLDELTVYKDFLNEHLLFQEDSLAKIYVATHDKLSAQGKDVEDFVNRRLKESYV